MKILSILLLLGFLTACDVNTSSDVSIDARDITYFKDRQTGLCFAILASRRSWTFITSGLGFTEVPCENIKG